MTKNPSPSFVTVVLGPKPAYHWQGMYALLTALGHTDRSSQLMVITDQPKRYAWFGDLLKVIPVTSQEIDRWAGPYQFRWRFKHEALLLAMQHSPQGIIYADSDVQVRAPLASMVDALERGEVFMHVREGVPSQARRGGHRRLWTKINQRSFAGLHVQPTDAMWNAGVVAVGSQGVELLRSALEACDAMGAAGALDNLSEQYCFSAVLQRTGALRPADSWIDHYWGNKLEWQQAILERLAEIHQLGMQPREAAQFIAEQPLRVPLHIKSRWWNSLARRWSRGQVTPYPFPSSHS